MIPWANQAPSSSQVPIAHPAAGIIYHKDTRIQLLDLPGIIEGASEGSAFIYIYQYCCLMCTV